MPDEAVSASKLAPRSATGVYPSVPLIERGAGLALERSAQSASNPCVRMRLSLRLSSPRKAINST